MWETSTPTGDNTKTYEFAVVYPDAVLIKRVVSTFKLTGVVSTSGYKYIFVSGGDPYLFRPFVWSRQSIVAAEIFDTGLTEVFPDLDNESDFPEKTLSIHQSPDGSMYWLMGQEGEVKKVRSARLVRGANVRIRVRCGNSRPPRYARGGGDLLLMRAQPGYRRTFWYVMQQEVGRLNVTMR